MQFLSDVTLAGDPDLALEPSTKQYVDGGKVYAQTTVPVVASSILFLDTDSTVTEGGGGVLVLGPTAPIPGGTPSGTVIVRTAT
jgi:hypothetical protein